MIFRVVLGKTSNAHPPPAEVSNAFQHMHIKKCNQLIIESLRFRLVAYSRCASHRRSAPRCALRFRHFFNEGSGELEIWYHKLQVALYMRHIIYKIIFEANNYLGCKDESPATRPFPSQKGKCISYTQVCSPPCTKHLWYSIILSFHHSHSSV